MAIKESEVKYENVYLKNTIKEIKSQSSNLGVEINVKSEEEREFKRLLWEEKGSIDSVEMKTSLMVSEMEARFILMKMEYYKKLIKIENNPYFGRIDFTEEGGEKRKIYIGLTHLEKDLNYLIYDWRSPIASLFYDYGIGKAMYEAPEGIIKGDMSLRRQYTIENGKLIRIFDNDLNVVDECLQDVLSTTSSDKMKNIVNTIQSEQNEVIRNVNDKNLIVQGIAGSGKTSVALHRIAFLLYKIKNLRSNNVLIFSPNNVFSEYISNVLPELGEDNALQTTFHDFAKSYIKEYKQVETFTDFIEKYYTKNALNKDVISFKLSNKMIPIIENYAKELESKINFSCNLETKFETVEESYLNYLLKERYNKLPLYQRIEKIAEHLCDKLGLKQGKEKRHFIKELNNMFNIKKDFKQFYHDLYLSKSFEEVFGKTHENKIVGKEINYEDALCFIYLKGILEGFPYSNEIKQIVIDEAQDYNEMQYVILSKIFKKASFTILGDVNQTINPYQKYDTLEVLTDILKDNSRYVELNKTYRSSFEIIEYANKVLDLKHVSAIRRSNNVPVKFRDDLSSMIGDINDLKSKYESVAIITKDNEEAIKLYEMLKDKVKDISIMDDKNEFNKNLVIVPSYLAKGLEFDSVISYTDKNNKYTKEEKYLFYVVVTRAQHELIIYNPSIK